MMDMEKDLENMFIIIFGSLVTTIYFSLSIPSLVEFFTGEKTVRERLSELEERVSLLEMRVKG
tara:strand:+ start:180 stop:368 length:189 start_codon:yes stop_codon:yes gene_type:complete